jgi:UDP-N-acetylmuramate dehydrogenase
VWDDFVAYTVEKGWYGAENLSLIPGEVGASAVQNIGAYGVEAKDLIVKVDTLEVETGKERVFGNEECGYAYRESVFKHALKGKYIVTHVTYRLSKHPSYRLDYGNVHSELEKRGCELTLENVRRTIIDIRESKLPDPKVQGNAGSFFMNPIVPRPLFEELLSKYPSMPFYEVDAERVKIPAAWMIDQCGWKGKQLGRAGVHNKQALVLVNCGGATGQEIIALSEEIQRSVLDKFGVRISPEVNFI